MKHFFITCIVTILFSFNSFAQESPVNIPPGVDVNNVKPSDIPSAAELKKGGATDAQIEQLMKFKNQGDNTTTPLKQEGRKQQSEEQKNAKQKTAEEQKSAEEQKTEEVEDIALKRRNAVPEEPETIFGHSFFKKSNIKFYDKANQLKASDNYLLDVGDELSVAIWGYSDFNDEFKIDENGAINPKLVGRIYLKGLTF
ncbi:MAG: polysaccharide biosynthesis/export family protein, partial [Bacteroidetes bacterium]|nr:polysaccharide biosynthesis/export family protein [Bacteroidota bacterium]